MKAEAVVKAVAQMVAAIGGGGGGGSGSGGNGGEGEGGGGDLMAAATASVTKREVARVAALAAALAVGMAAEMATAIAATAAAAMAVMAVEIEGGPTAAADRGAQARLGIRAEAGKGRDVRGRHGRGMTTGGTEEAGEGGIEKGVRAEACEQRHQRKSRDMHATSTALEDGA